MHAFAVESIDPRPCWRVVLGPSSLPIRLTGRPLRRALVLSPWEGAFHAVMVGCAETYFAANAVRLGASTLELGLLFGLPLAVGALGPMLSLAIVRRLGRRRPWTVACALGQASSLLLLAALQWRGSLTVSGFILIVCAYQVCGLAAGNAWSSWYGDLVPEGRRGRYFALRGRVAQVATLTSLVGAGIVLQRLEPGAAGLVLDGSGGAGFLVLFLVAAGSRALSALLLALSPEPRMHGLAQPRQVLRFFATDRGQRAGRVLLFGGLIQLSAYVASPYFQPFMLETLGLDYLEYMAATLCVVVGKILAFPVWGRAIDAHGARPVLGLVSTLVALVPAPWLFAGGLPLVLGAQLGSGISWAGWEVSYFSVLLEWSFRRTRAHVFAAQNLLNGMAQLTGSALGGLLLSAVGGRYQLVFGVSLALRLAMAAMQPRIVPPGEPGAVGRRALALRIVGFRPSGGLAMRPVLPPEAQEPEELGQE